LVCHDSVQGSEFAIPLDPDDAIFADGINVSEHGLAICMGRERDLLGKWLPEMFGRHAVYVFDVASGAELGRPFRKGVRSCFAPDGKTLALTDRNSHVTLWDWPPRSRWPICILAGLSVIGVSLAVSTWHARRRKNRQPAFATAGLADNR
jgi:hypothetical protein